MYGTLSQIIPNEFNHIGTEARITNESPTFNFRDHNN